MSTESLIQFYQKVAQEPALQTEAEKAVGMPMPELMSLNPEQLQTANIDYLAVVVDVAAKHGVLGLTKVAALELANAGVTVNAICPGWVLTPLVEKQIQDRAAQNGTSVEEESHKLLAEKQPMLQFTKPEQIGGLAVFLCSDAAATMTGTPVSIDGGWVAQ